MAHDYPVDPTALEGEKEEPMPVSEARRNEIFNTLMRYPVERLVQVLSTACKEELEPGLTDEQFEALLRRCPPNAIEGLRARLQKHGSPAGQQRLETMLQKIAGAGGL